MRDNRITPSAGALGRTWRACGRGRGRFPWRVGCACRRSRRRPSGSDPGAAIWRGTLPGDGYREYGRSRQRKVAREWRPPDVYRKNLKRGITTTATEIPPVGCLSCPHEPVPRESTGRRRPALRLRTGGGTRSAMVKKSCATLPRWARAFHLELRRYFGGMVYPLRSVCR